MNLNVLEIILTVFFITLIVTFIFRRLRLSVILGYLLVGALTGPHALELVPNTPNIKELAEFGIVFLMFTVGLEFSVPKLFSLRYPVFIIGGLQVLLTISLSSVIGILLGMTPLSALVVGSIVAMSSTAIVVKQLNDQLELHTPYGLNAVGILLFQDLAVIPLFILIASFHNPKSSLMLVLIWALMKGLIAILLIFFLGRALLKPVFRMIAQTRAIEIFTLAVLLVTLTAAALTHVLGLSYALGAFLAGMMLAETEFRHQIEIEIRPFRDILLGLFFVTIGMLVDVSTWHLTWLWILLLLSALVIGKTLLITLISYFSKNNPSVSLRTGLVLAQGGEFGFALLTLALNHEIIPQNYAQVILAALLISIVISPLLIRFNKKIAEWLAPYSTRAAEKLTRKTIEMASKNLTKHIVICGFGRVGQHIARLLDKVGIPYVGLEYNAELVKNASLAGDNVIYGDASHPDILRAANIKQADALVICVGEHKAATRILAMARQKYPRLPILARCRDEFELKELKKLGASEIIAELFETSLTLSHHVLQLIKIPRDKIANIIQEVRNTDYDLLQKVFTSEFSAEDAESSVSSLYAQLLPISITSGAHAVGHTLDDLKLKEIGVEVMAIRRGDSKQVRPRGKTMIHENDIVIVYGPSMNLAAAERRLLEG